jgi:hypothetical protein
LKKDTKQGISVKVIKELLKNETLYQNMTMDAGVPPETIKKLKELALEKG